MTPLLHPRHWPTWAAFGMLRLAILLPLPALRTLGRVSGRLYQILGRRRARIARINVDLCFPELSDAERAALVRRHFEAVGIGVFELGLAWWASDRRLRRITTWHGLEHLRTAHAQGKGVILLGVHFTDLEITGRLLSLYQPFAVMYRPHENPVIEWAFSRSRQRRFEAAIPRNDIRQVVRTLKQNLPVWYAPDQSFKGRNSTLAPFFGEPAGTNTATSRLAKISSADTLLFCGYRLPGKQGYRLVIHPPLDDFPSEDIQQDATRINGLIEQAVGYAPEQYLWIHRRFKKRKVIPDPY
ncbi:MAG: LpxL/LpxP family Kdo(2)-lipid IV(A) lauroyl/palmitoleoyl acyltransferase [Acidihalobacter sp.]